MKAYMDHIVFVQKKISLLSSIANLLYWDGSTHMPKKGVKSRAEQVKLIEGMIHKELADKQLYMITSHLDQQKLSVRDSVMVQKLSKEIRKARKVPQWFREEMIRAKTITYQKWEQAKKDKDATLFLPHLKKLVQYKRTYAQYINPKKKPYDTLLDEYEEGLTSEQIDSVFSYLKKEILSILEKIKQDALYDAIMHMNKTVKKGHLIDFIRRFLVELSLDPDRVNLDTSTHPFSIKIARNDVRITTRSPRSVYSFFDAVHEAGHALYAIGIPKDFTNTILSEPASVGMDESQAFLWENFIAKDKDTCNTLYQELIDYLPEISGIQFYQGINKVKPSSVRLDADEVTYCLHIILRYEIERDLINGVIQVEDIAHQWKEKMKSLLGVVPKDDSFMQDDHWADGAFGYFPSYALGLIYAAQIHNTMKREIKGYQELIHTQEFRPIIEWLEHHIHCKGSTYTPLELIKKATKETPNPKYYIRYLHEKYKEIYQNLA